MEDSKSPDFMEQFYLDCGFATRALHAGEHVGQPHTSAHANPIYQTSTFVFRNAQEGADMFSGAQSGYVYTRLGNPTVRMLESRLNALEGAGVKLGDPSKRVSSLAFSSGMAAVSGTLMATCVAGDTILLGDVVYGATEHLCSNVLSRLGIKTVEVDFSNLEQVERTLKAHPGIKAALFETPVNPTMKLADIAAVSKLVHRHCPAAVVIIDNTFATPYLQRPLELGADVVLHSTTKYIGGHGTVVGGIVTTANEKVKE